MSTISLTSAPTPAGAFGKVFAKIAEAFRARHDAAALAGLSEREFQDIGWGQSDRWSHALNDGETPPERRARAVAVAAWHGSNRKAA